MPKELLLHEITPYLGFMELFKIIRHKWKHCKYDVYSTLKCKPGCISFYNPTSPRYVLEIYYINKLFYIYCRHNCTGNEFMFFSGEFDYDSFTNMNKYFKMKYNLASYPEYGDVNGVKKILGYIEPEKIFGALN